MKDGEISRHAASSLRGEAVEMLRRYLLRHPLESDDLSAFARQLRDDEGDPFHRSNMRGHVTASALVLDHRRENAVLIHHKLYDRWLQPGGHVENDASLWAAACREVAEETGLAGLSPWAADGALEALDIDSHAIPANPRKGEGSHWHHDIVLLAAAPAGLDLNPQLEEVHAVRWMPLHEIAEMEGRRVQRLARKALALLDAADASNPAGNSWLVANPDARRAPE